MRIVNRLLFVFDFPPFRLAALPRRRCGSFPVRQGGQGLQGAGTGRCASRRRPPAPFPPDSFLSPLRVLPTFLLQIHGLATQAIFYPEAGLARSAPHSLCARKTRKERRPLLHSQKKNREKETHLSDHGGTVNSNPIGGRVVGRRYQIENTATGQACPLPWFAAEKRHLQHRNVACRFSCLTPVAISPPSPPPPPLPLLSGPSGRAGARGCFRDLCRYYFWRTHSGRATESFFFPSTPTLCQPKAAHPHHGRDRRGQ